MQLLLTLLLLALVPAWAGKGGPRPGSGRKTKDPGGELAASTKVKLEQ